ncbi:MAG TPA: stage V sporulation protein AC [Candidatus Faecaligallichristensenella faecipullorum]|nr:stage V sporulation protein AC [Candidatus Faecaligallichristensenella faecipullorum]
MSDQQKFKEYDQMVKRMTPNSQYFQGFVRAFWVGGLICVLGQLISMAGEYWLHLDQSGVSMFTSIVLVFLGTTLTGLGIYDRIGCYAGAGSVVPITGFANSVAAPALEFRREGMILGLGAKLFQIAGPVLVYGIGSSVVAGVIYWIIVRWF